MSWNDRRECNLYGNKPKLTPADREEISYRRMEGEMPMALAAEYGVVSSVIKGIAKKERP